MIAAAVFLVLSCAIMIHHRIKHGYWFDKHDVDNHETVALFMLGMAIGTAVGTLLGGG